MRTVTLLPEHQSEIAALIEELDQLKAQLQVIEKQIDGVRPVPDDAIQQIRECWHREWAIIDRLTAIGRT